MQDDYICPVCKLIIPRQTGESVARWQVRILTEHAAQHLAEVLRVSRDQAVSVARYEDWRKFFPPSQRLVQTRE